MFDFNNFETVLTNEFPNFAAEVAEGRLERFFDEDIHQVAGYKGWKLALITQADVDGDFIFPMFSRPQHSYFSTLGVRILINPTNHFNPKNEKFTYSDRFYFEMGFYIKGKKMYLSEILDEKNGWLKDGTFTVKIGFYAESLLDRQGCWRFNFLNDPFERKSDSDVVYFYEGSTCLRVMCHIQLLKLHCKNLHKKMTAENKIRGIPYFDDMKKCLDLLHGVQLKCGNNDYARILEIAKTLKFSNIIHYIELQFIENPEEKKTIRGWILFAVRSNLNRLLLHLLEKLEDPSGLKEMVKEMDIGMMSGESMKICMMKLLYESE